MHSHVPKFVLVVIVFINPFLVSAQDKIGPPSLSIGTNEVLFSKGILDTELIGEIIAEKQEEIKRAYAMNLILNGRLSKGPFLIYSHAEKTLEALLNHKEKGVIKKALLENATELGLVLGITEAYMRIMQKTMVDLERKYYTYAKDSSDSILDKYLTLIKYNTAEFKLEKDTLPLTRLLTINKVVRNQSLRYTSINTESSGIGEFLPKISYLYQLKKLGKTNNTYLHYILLDMVLAICRENQSLQKLGFFSSDFDQQAFDAKSHYVKFSLLDPTKMRSTYKKNAYKVLKKDLEDIEADIRKKITLNLKYASVILNQPTGTDTTDNATLKEKFNDAFMKNLELDYIKDLSEKELEVMKKMGNLVNFANNAFRTDQVEDKFDDLVLEIQSLMPDLLSLSAKIDGLNDIILILDSLSNSISINQFESFKGKLEEQYKNNSQKENGSIDTNLSDMEKKKITQDSLEQRRFVKKNLAEVFNVITKLNKAASYNQVANLIIDVGNIFYSINDSRLLSEIANLKNYLIVNQDSNRVDIKVEDLILYLNKKYVANSSSNMSLYFTVGYNYLAGGKSDQNVSFAAEKIGMKIKLYDNYKQRTYKSRHYFKKRKPVMNDIYFLIYASGLLYQVEALKSENSFKGGSYGGAIGFHFFNGLDFNLGLASVRFDGDRKVAFNAGFDIQISEYLARLKKKK